MKTAADIIQEIDELSFEERQKVAEYFNSDREDEFLIENYSPEDIAKIIQSGKEAKCGINMSGPFTTTEEIIAHLEYIEKSDEN